MHKSKKLVYNLLIPKMHHKNVKKRKFMEVIKMPNLEKKREIIKRKEKVALAGAGTKADPYKIGTAAELASIGDKDSMER